MLGTLTKTPEGLRLMEKAKIFTLLYHLSDLRGRDDIITAAIENLHYQM
jgi:rapamycin-insensitive companion of mTOR